MTDVRALSVFQERVKSLLGSFLDVLLVEITEAYRESFADSMCLSHCKCHPDKQKLFKSGLFIFDCCECM